MPATAQHNLPSPNISQQKRELDRRTVRSRMRHSHINRRILFAIQCAAEALECGDIQCAKMILVRILMEQEVIRD